MTIETKLNNKGKGEYQFIGLAGLNKRKATAVSELKILDDQVHQQMYR